jgi:hypothetical protein
MNTLTNEQVGLQIKQTINKLNKKMMVGYFQNQNLKKQIKKHSTKQ